jgi:hypothetical protein
MKGGYQAGHFFARGKRSKIWVSGYVEPVLENGKERSALRLCAIGSCNEMNKSEARTILQGWLVPFNEGTFAAVEAAGFREFCRKREADSLAHFTWRSLRGSAEGVMAKSGISLKASQAVLGRSNPNTTLVYAETDEAAKRQAELGRLIFPELSQFAIAIGSVNRLKTKPLEWRNCQTQQTQNLGDES